MPVQAHVHPTQQPEPSLWSRPMRGKDAAFLCTRGVHALEGGCSVPWPFVYMQIFVIKTIS